MRGMQGDAQRMPKKTPAYMVYLHKHPERIDDVYKAEKNTSSKTGIALRNEIARRLFAASLESLWDNRSRELGSAMRNGVDGVGMSGGSSD